MLKRLKSYLKILLVIVPIGLGLSEFRSGAQIVGCTDPVAVNYNSSAKVNDGSCIYNPASTQPLSSRTLSGTISETSGLIFWNNSIWTHNDNLDRNIYSLDTITGKILNAYPLDNIQNNDWEEISQDNDFIYIGDFGNNAGNRTDLRILKISKNSLLNNSPVVDSINFSYSNQADFTPSSNNTDFDCEAFIVSDDSIYLFTKQWISQMTSFYSLPKKPGSYVAEFKSTFNVQGLITGGVYLESKKIIALSGYSKSLDPFIYLLYDFKGHRFFSGNKRKISVLLNYHQMEGIATYNGIKFYISNERFSLPPLINIPQQLHILDLSPFMGRYLGLGSPVPDDEVNFIISPVPVQDLLTVRSYVNMLPVDFKLISISGQIIKTGRITSEYSIINVADLASGIYFLKVGAEKKNSYKLIKQ